jgi:hypothetical protein
VRWGEQPPWIVPDGLWQRIEPLLPPRDPRHPGRNRLPDRLVWCGILFVPHTGIQWELLPQEVGFGSGMTCWRRLEGWNAGGVWRQLYEPGRPRPAGLQAPHPDRRRGCPPGSLVVRRQPPRHHPTAPADRQGPTRPRPAPPTPGPAVRRPRLRLRQVPPGRSRQRNPYPHRPSRPTTRLRTRDERAIAWYPA